MSLQDAQTNTQLTPDAFKSLIVKKYPNGVSSDGTPYSQMDATELTKRISQKYPNGVTNDGHKYSDYLPKEQNNTTQENKPGFVQSLIQGVANPILSVARMPAGLIEKGLGAVTGNKGLQQAGNELTSNQPQDFGYFGKVNSLGFDQNGQPLSAVGSAGQGLGIGAQIAPWLLGAGEAQNLAQTAGQQTIGTLIKSGAKTGAGIGGLIGAGTNLQKGIESNQDTASVIGNTLVGGGEGAVSGAVGGGLFGLGSGVLSKVLGKIGQDVPAMEAIDAVNPNLTGKKLSAQYAKGGLQGRVSPGGLFSPQSVAPDPAVLKLGQSLSDIGLSGNASDSASNLVKLGTALQNTEAKITPFNEFPVSSGVKRFTISQLENLKTNIPEEFKGINESQSMFSKVIDYAKRLVSKTDDTIGGYRTTRGDFYDSMKTQFPSSFDDQGRFNMRTPAGRAGKMVYDFLNKNLFDIAPKNSGLPELIQRESDIYQAARNIAPKAKAYQGLSGWQKFIKNNPRLMGALKLGAETVGIGGGIGLVGRFINSSSGQ